MYGLNVNEKTPKAPYEKRHSFNIVTQRHIYDAGFISVLSRACVIFR